MTILYAIVATGAVLSWVAFGFWLGITALDHPKVWAGVLAYLSLTIGVPVGMVLEVGKSPCHKYETQLMYNAATKTMMPSRVCVLRGEWVEEEIK